MLSKTIGIWPINRSVKIAELQQDEIDVGSTVVSHSCRFMYGLGYEKNSEDGEAREQFDRALQLNPHQTERNKIQEALATVSKSSVPNR